MHQNFKAIQLPQKLFYSIGPWSSYLLSLGFKMYFAVAAAFEAIGDANSLFDLTVLLLEMVLITMLLMAFLVA